MNKTQLQYFLATARCQSMNAAAQEFNVTRQTLTQQIKQLEEELNTELFERIGRKVVLTSAGNIYADFARETLVALDKTHDTINSLKYGVNEYLVIGSSQTSLTEDIAKYTAKLSDLYPNIKFKLLFRPLWLLRKMMEFGDVDVIFSHQIAHDCEFGDQYEIQKIGSHKVLAVIPPELDFGNSETISLKELDGKKIIVREKHEASFLKKCSQYGAKPRVTCICNQSELKIELIKNNVGIGIFTDAYASMIKSANLKSYYVKEIKNVFNEYIIYPRNRKNENVQKLLEVVIANKH